MSTDKIWQGSTKSSEETEKLGELLGQNLKGGEALELISDLGGGKTTLTRGIVKGFGSTDKVSSPTFTVNKEYYSGNKRIVHYDFYRLQDPGLMSFELAESLNDKNAVSIVEWADIVHDVIPDQRVMIYITTPSDGDENSRYIKIVASETLSYLLKDLQEQK